MEEDQSLRKKHYPDHWQASLLASLSFSSCFHYHAESFRSSEPNSPRISADQPAELCQKSKHIMASLLKHQIQILSFSDHF